MVDNDDDDAPIVESTRNFDCKDGDYVVEAEPPQLFSQSELNDLVRDLSLSKESSELLASRFKEKPPTSRNKDFHLFFFYVEERPWWPIQSPNIRRKKKAKG